MGFYLYISNRDSEDSFLSNKPDNFMVSLGQDYCLKGNWKVAVTEITVKLNFENPAPEQLCILLNICEPSFVAGHYKQIVRRLNIVEENVFHSTYSHPYFVNVNIQTFKNLNVQVLNEILKPSGLTGDILFTLLFKKV